MEDDFLLPIDIIHLDIILNGDFFLDYFTWCQEVVTPLLTTSLI